MRPLFPWPSIPSIPFGSNLFNDSSFYPLRFSFKSSFLISWIIFGNCTSQVVCQPCNISYLSCRIFCKGYSMKWSWRSLELQTTEGPLSHKLLSWLSTKRCLSMSSLLICWVRRSLYGNPMLTFDFCFSHSYNLSGCSKWRLQRSTSAGDKYYLERWSSEWKLELSTDKSRLKGKLQLPFGLVQPQQMLHHHQQ